MKIVYIGHSRFPTEKAHGYQIAHVCSAMSTLGHDVTLVCPVTENPITQTCFDYYEIPRTFGVRMLPVRSKGRLLPGFLQFRYAMRRYSEALKMYFQSETSDVIYLRAPSLLPTALKQDIPVILELHSLPRVARRRFVKLCNQCRYCVCLTSLMAKDLVSWGVEKSKIIVEGDAVNPKFFNTESSEIQAKARWKLPADRPAIGYIGSLVTQNTVEKGVRELLQAFAILRDKGIPFQGWIVGGPSSWVEKYRLLVEQLRLGSCVRLQGFLPAREIPSALTACDVCVYPAPASKSAYFFRDTSPLKLFEYLAAGKPVVCANIPPVRDVVDESCVWFCEPGNPHSLATALEQTLSQTDERQRKVDRARTIMRTRTWEERMRKILDRVA